MALRLSEVEEIRCENGQKVINWLSQCRYFSKRRIHVVKNDEDRLVIKLYTSEHTYQFYMTDNDYLSCSASTRKPRPGEGWTRGNGLCNGRVTRRLFNEILGAIVFYEAKEVMKTRPLLADEMMKTGQSAADATEETEELSVT